MASPTLAVRIGIGPDPDALQLNEATYGKLDTAKLGDGLSYEWDDVTAYVREQTGVTINRGGTNNRGPYFNAEAGVCTFTLDNRDSRFDPFHEGAQESGTAFGSSTYGSGTYGTTISSNPYWDGGESILRPGLPVNVRATFDGVTYDLFTGKVTSWNVSYPEKAIDSVVTVNAADAVSELAMATPAESPTELGPGETPTARIARILDAIDWPSERRGLSSTDGTAMLSTFLGRPAWEEMQATADAVNGYLWASPSGVVRFQSKSQFPRRADFAVGKSGVPTAEIMVSNDISQLYNVVALSREDGNTQTVTDAASIAKYGRRSFDRSGLPLETDAAVGASVSYILSQHRNHRLRLDGFRIQMHGGSADADWRTMLRLDLLRRIVADFDTPHGNTILREGLVRGLNLRIRATVWEWSVSTTAAPESLGDFTLDDGSLGLLDTGVLAAF